MQAAKTLQPSEMSFTTFDPKQKKTATLCLSAAPTLSFFINNSTLSAPLHALHVVVVSHGAGATEQHTC